MFAQQTIDQGFLIVNHRLANDIAVKLSFQVGEPFDGSIVKHAMEASLPSEITDIQSEELWNVFYVMLNLIVRRIYAHAGIKQVFNSTTPKATVDVNE
ncbi:MAG: hypothetical protein R2728_00750 [Chitinophagales bacterium]